MCGNGVDSCYFQLSGMNLSDSNDSWKWSLNAEDGFSVKSLRGLIAKPASNKDGCNIGWCSWLPKKVNIFCWRLALDRLPTRMGMALAQQGINIGSSSCPLCSEAEESSDHLFSNCMVATIVWLKISVIPGRLVK
ncbi:putative reverse transcriptase zinc-binding domain-containing protein [Helianthus annuus]|uniref:Reverse transcriptase zinc-binding domain-containing protein n=1 Tax=Helianthus annuus TaxID=4232 RepID=A0A9K3J551_HELAN|nr:putative reverse transcriptase zinc-binding domain-containing protein [Helianthus annuus]KAJ0929710.1 putative reverse transcriptase zinc-binding domain-containing protein [Helianthus annuus]